MVYSIVCKVILSSYEDFKIGIVSL